MGHAWEAHAVERSLGGKFLDVWRDLRDNIIAIFTDQAADWSKLQIFYQEVFFPWLIGGIAPGLITAVVAYYVSLPLVIAYQKRRKGFLKEKILSLKKKKSTLNNKKR